jgi:hypothetical protein
MLCLIVPMWKSREPYERLCKEVDAEIARQMTDLASAKREPTVQDVVTMGKEPKR